jgi:hypothetical protein
MSFCLSPDYTLSCEVSDPLFRDNIRYLLNITNSYLNQITDVDCIDDQMLCSLGEKCFEIALIKISTGKLDSLLDESQYHHVFKGHYSDTFIQIMLDIQLLWQVKENLDTYTGFSISKDYVGGVSPSDKKHFYTTLKDMNNKLKILNHLIQKRS